MITKQSIEAAAANIQSNVSRTPMLYSLALSELAGCKVLFKLETLHRTGAYKERGALNKILAIQATGGSSGIVAASAGNHAQAVAFHATRLRIPSTIVMPTTTPLVKVSVTRSFGANVILYGDTYDDAFAHAKQLERDQQLTLVHAFDDPHVIAGQGTVAIEILNERRLVGAQASKSAGESLQDGIDAVICPVGGGGLISGIATYVKESRPSIEVVGVEAEACPAMQMSVAAGKRVTIDKATSLADGIAVKSVGELTFEIVKNYVDDIVTVSEHGIATAILLLLERERLLVEGAGAVGLAAVFADRDRWAGKTVVVILSGGNIDVNILQRIISRGLVQQGRIVQVRVRYRDVAGSMSDALAIIKNLHSNILHIEHERFGVAAPFGFVDATLTLETTGFDHVQDIKNALGTRGFLVDVPGADLA